MTVVPRALRWAVTALMVLLVGVAVAGSAAVNQVIIGATLGAIFLTIYLGGAVYAVNVHGSAGVPVGQRRDHRAAIAWVLALTLLWVGLLIVSDSAMWLAFPLILLQVGVLVAAWGAVVAVCTMVLTTAVSVSRLSPGDSFVGPVLGPMLGGLIAIVFMWGIMTITRESHARKQALEELQKTRVELAHAEEDRVLVRERHRLAGELHDTVSQGLSATAMLLRAAQSSPDPNVCDALVAQALAATEANLTEARRITTALTPAELSSARLPLALRALVEQPIDDDLEVDVQIGAGRFDLPLMQEAALLRVAQSALWNVREHAGANHVVIRLEESPEVITLEVADDGHGFLNEQSAEVGRGLGIPTMTARVEAVGGRLIATSSGEGTTVTARIPKDEVSQ
ncbi:sensor histidine kinase [Schaalia sp. JY-X169]|uniref:sensor histidine kinase n=1 Tax=Schaalia sp. JY-X169 TaxID=2758572 RepID=UPI0015F5B926|nr:histidine kinase [Schaalia sp. JY-X169]